MMTATLDSQENNKIYSFLIYVIVIFSAISYFGKKTFAGEMNGIQKPDEVVVVSNPNAPVYKNDLKMRVAFIEELSIGEVQGDENYMFGGSIVFNTDEEGNFYVADFGNNRILKYNPQGKYLLTIGRKGQGPGEFRDLSVPRFDKDNNLYVADSVNRRISFFDGNGKFLRQIQMQERYLDPYINSKSFIVANKWNMFQEANVLRQTSLYGLFDDKFNLVIELYKDEIETPWPGRFDESSIVQFLEDALSLTAFRPQVRLTLANNDFIYLGYPDKYEINIYSPEGKIVKRITREYEPIQVTEKDKESFVKTASKGFSAPIYTDDIKKKAFQKIKYPKYKPAYYSFTLMENGWLAVIVDSLEGEYTLFDIFDQDGRYIANFKTSIPAEGMFSGSLFFKNGKAYAVVTKDDYKFVKRYRFEIQEYKDK
jgi:hypothetical protein